MPSINSTVISVNGSDDPPDPDGLLVVRPPVNRTSSNRSTVVSMTAGPTATTAKNKKLGHRRVGQDGEITYKKFETTQLMGSIQLGISHAVGQLASVPQRDILFPDFTSIDTVHFTRNGQNVGGQVTPAHSYQEFRFRTYSANAFRYFRALFCIQQDQFLASLCGEPMIELSNPGASGSIFYKTKDDNFIVKTVMHKEADFLQKLLGAYYINLQQNPKTLLPKFFGLYCYSCNAKNVRIIVMNNLLPSGLRMHHRFDLKGSTYKRKASKRERNKDSPTYKDLDFMEIFPEGILMQHEIHSSLMNTIQRDCRVLESLEIMDYSLLIGIHNIDVAAKEGEVESLCCASEADSSSTEGRSGFDRQGSVRDRERMIAHSTALESIRMDMESETHYVDETDADNNKNNVWGGIPAKNHRGENLLLFIGIIDILQEYGVAKKVEHAWKSLIHDGDTVSVHRPEFYAKRFQQFLGDKVFKKMPIPLRPAASFRRSHFKRAMSHGEGETSVNVPIRGGAQDGGVTVITIGDEKDEICLPAVLNQRKRTEQVESPETTPPKNITVQRVLLDPLMSNTPPPAYEEHETGSIITMTSDEKVQIYVPSPQSTPYNTITKSDVSTMQWTEGTPPPFLHRVLSDSYRSITPLNMESPQHRDQTTVETVSSHLETTSLEMVRISINSSNSGTPTVISDRTIRDADLPSLPNDEPKEPVSLSDIKLEEKD